MSKKDFSFWVIIPTYNRYELLDRALASLTGQTCNDFCCVVVDDASQDTNRVRSIIEKYTSVMDIVFHINQHNRGVSHARNIGAEMLADRVSYFCFLDSDDEYSSDAIQVRAEMLRKYPDSECLVTWFTLIGSPYVKDRDHPECLLHVNNCGLPWRGNGTRQLTLKNESFFRIGRFNETGFYGEDIDIVDRCKSYKLRKRLTRKSTYIYHREPHDQLTNIV